MKAVQHFPGGTERSPGSVQMFGIQCPWPDQTPGQPQVWADPSFPQLPVAAQPHQSPSATGRTGNVRQIPFGVNRFSIIHNGKNSSALYQLSTWLIVFFAGKQRNENPQTNLLNGPEEWKHFKARHRRFSRAWGQCLWVSFTRLQ